MQNFGEKNLRKMLRISNIPGGAGAVLERIKKKKSCIERKEKSTSLISLIHSTQA